MGAGRREEGGGKGGKGGINVFTQGQLVHGLSRVHRAHDREKRDREGRGKGRKGKRETGHKPKAEECHPIYCITGRLSIQWKLSAFVARRYLDDICARETERQRQRERKGIFLQFHNAPFSPFFKDAEI